MSDPANWQAATDEPVAERIADHRDYASRLARQIHAKLPPHVTFDELEQDAMLGLTRAAQRYDLSRDAAFTTFAYKYIRGAVFDGIRKQTWMPPAARRQEAEDDVSSILDGADPAASFDDLAHQFENQVRMLGTVFRLTDVQASDDESAQDLEPEAAERTDQIAERADLIGRLREVLTELPEDQRRVIEGHYLEGKSFREIATELDLHPANVTRRHHAALGFLSETLGAAT